MIIVKKTRGAIAYSSFSSNVVNDEYFISITPNREASFEEILKNIRSEYEETMKKEGLDQKTQIFFRFYLSDIANQKNVLFSSAIFKMAQNSAYSVVEQCPLHGGKAAVFCYHIKNNSLKKETAAFDERGWRNSAKISGTNYDMLWSANISEAYPFDSEAQTKEIFLSYNKFLKRHDCSLIKNTLRTWIFTRDIDNHYQGMVKARKEFFRKEGLVPETRFIASTGIEGKSRETSTLVSMDALAMSKLDPRQIIRVEAREYLNPTHEYGVTFERGTRVDFGDRSHIYISGTASIDKNGHTLHVFDIVRQTERTIENMEALLMSQKATLKDFAYLIIYLRNITDAKMVREIIHEKNLDCLPLIILQGAVCRPEWLVEMEGVAIINNTSSWPNFI